MQCVGDVPVVDDPIDLRRRALSFGLGQLLGPLRRGRLIPPALALILALALSLSACSSAANPRPMQPLTIAAPTSLEAAIPLLVAADQGFFASHGLSVTLVPYDSGLAATNDLLKGKVDVAGPVSEYVLVGQDFQSARVQTLASFDRLEFTSIVGRQNRGIRAVSDLKGKRIGIVRGTSSEFYLGRFLQLHGLSSGDVALVDTGTLAAGVDWIARGDVNAIAITEPYAHAAQARLGDGAVVWPAQSSQPVYGLLLAGNAWIEGHPGAAEQLVGAIGQAESYVAQHPAEAQAIAKRRLGLSDADVEAVWARNDFSLSLDMGLVAAMEDEARWMIQNNLTAAKQVPDIEQYIYTDALQAVNPDAVDIIR